MYGYYLLRMKFLVALLISHLCIEIVNGSSQAVNNNIRNSLLNRENFRENLDNADRDAAPENLPKSGAIYKRQEREQLYEAYNLLHTLAQVNIRLKCLKIVDNDSDLSFCRIFINHLMLQQY